MATNLSILFIEDDDLIRSNYATFLKNDFKEVFEARDAESAYLIYNKYKPEILIVDINLPGMSGLDFLEKIRRTDISTKAIMFTANTGKDFLLRASELKLSKYLVKPIQSSELKDALEFVKKELLSYEIIPKDIIPLKNNFFWDNNKKELFVENELVNLTKKEQEVLEKLFSNLEHTITYDELLIDVWDSFDSSKIDLIKTTIKKLRKKLPEDTILNVYGQGYKIILK